MYAYTHIIILKNILDYRTIFLNKKFLSAYGYLRNLVKSVKSPPKSQYILIYL